MARGRCGGSAHACRPARKVARAVALDLSPLIAAKDIDFSIKTEAVPIESHDWMLTELTRNLLHNAIAHTPAGGALAVQIGRAHV